MKNLFWIFRIRGKIKKIVSITERECAFFNDKLKNQTCSEEKKYLTSRIELKKEVIEILENLLK
jgi:hypothetical protein